MMKLLILWILTGASCMIRDSRRYNLKVYGGSKAAEGEFPYHVGIGVYEKFAWCGGSIIHKSYVVSAAHCYDIYNKVYKGKTLAVITGTTQLNEPKKGVWYKIKNSIVHPKHNPDTSEFDILILKTDNPIALTPGLVEIAKLPNTNFIVLPDSKVEICGWGIDRPKHQSLILKKITLNVISEKDCQHDWSTQDSKRICVVSREKGWGTCNGDSGGGLMYKGYIIGVLSYGTGDCDLNVSEVYTDIRSYLVWIQGIFQKN